MVAARMCLRMPEAYLGGPNLVIAIDQEKGPGLRRGLLGGSASKTSGGGEPTLNVLHGLQVVLRVGDNLALRQAGQPQVAVKRAALAA